MTSGSGPAPPAPPRWLADEMLGRLARYLRFVGHDTDYVRGLDDREVLRVAKTEARALLTRDRALARQAPGALLIRSVVVGEQLREVFAAFPDVPREVTFDRCPECNQPLRRWSVPSDEALWPPGLPRALLRAGTPVWQCPACSRRYWEGSHATKIRAVVAEASSMGTRT